MKCLDEKKRTYLRVLIIALFSVFLAMSFYTVTGSNADEAGSYCMLYRIYELGYDNLNISQRLDPLYITLDILYRIDIFGNGIELVEVSFAIWYFFCIFITLILAMRHNANNWWVLLFCIFMLIPSSGTNKYHIVSIFVGLFTLYAVDKFVSEKKKFPIIISVLLIIYTLIVIGDKVLILMHIAVPTVVYMLIYCLQDKDKRRWIYIGGGVISATAAVIKLTDEALKIVTGNGLGILEAFSGYGGEEYLNWIDVQTFFDKGIPQIFSCLLTQFNIPIDGGMIQFNSLFWIVRIAIVLLFMAVLIERWAQIIKKGVKSLALIDSLSVICITCLIGVNMLNGMMKYYSIDGSPMNRYAGLAWFLIVIVAARWLDEKYRSFPIMTVKKTVITSGCMLGIIFVLLTMGYSKPIYLGRNSLVSEACQEEADYIMSLGSDYSYGVASYWKSTPITALTNGDVNVIPGWIEEDKWDIDREEWRDGSNCFDFIISYVDNSMTVSEENIDKLYGDFIDRKRFYDNGESVVWLYDYDIRWQPEIKVETVGEDYVITDRLQYYYDFPMGTNRIEMTVTNSENLELSIEDNPYVSSVSVNKLSDSKVQVDVICTQNTAVTFNVDLKTDELTTMSKIVLKRVKAAVFAEDVNVNGSNEVVLESGDYIFTFAGEHIKDMSVEWSGKDIEVSQLTDGRIRRRYAVTVKEPQTVLYNISGDGISLEGVSYEDAHLFDEELETE